MEKRFLNEKEVSILTGFKLPTLRNWRFLRKGPPWLKFGPGGSIKYDFDDVCAYMARHRIDPETPVKKGGRP